MIMMMTKMKMITIITQIMMLMMMTNNEVIVGITMMTIKRIMAMKK